MGKVKNRSLARQIAKIFLSLVAGTVLLCLLINSMFLANFYFSNKKKQLSDTFYKINKAAVDGNLYTDDFDITFESICANGNLIIIIISSDGTVLRASASNADQIRTQFFEIIFGVHASETEVITSTDSYVIQRARDSRLQEEYLALWGNLDDGTQILMRTPLESIKESVLIANRFLVYVGIISMIGGMLLVIFSTRRITKPVLELTDLSRRMSELDFDAKYKSNGKTKNEIDILGEHMNKMSENLEETISELKTANLELQKDLELKTEIDEMRKEFLSNVSHELKTPIALVQGYAEGLKECLNDDEESRNFYCSVIMDETNRMNEMVKKLLTLNQLESGSDVLEMERFDLTEMVNGVIASSKLLALQNGISLSFDEKEPSYVWADEFKIEEVVVNYLSNAIHHAAGEKKIVVSFRDESSLLRMSVFNTGKHIPEEDLDKIWIKFYKVDKARTREYGGNGIGLSIVKAIMERHGRNYGVVNQEDGVEFWIELDKDNTVKKY
ncbi:MAG: HAMP domain-containing histidine kinase [Eubacterium sp.]|nr:HAMP domain-containing histidine kinase [Eubacterium sp.]